MTLRSLILTSEELTELEDIVRKSIELHGERGKHTFGVEPIKAFTEQEKLLKSLHLKIQLMCIERSEGGES